MHSKVWRDCILALIRLCRIMKKSSVHDKNY